MEDLLWSLKAIDVDCPDLGDLTGQGRCQVWQVLWYLAIIRDPHEVSVDQDSKVVAFMVGPALVADQDCRDKFSGCAREAIQ